MDVVKCLKSCILSECHHMVIAVVGEREFKSKSSLWEKCFLFYFVLGFFCHVTSVNISLLSKSWSYYVSSGGLSEAACLLANELSITGH